jgi:hypothetical protein
MPSLPSPSFIISLCIAIAPALAACGSAPDASVFDDHGGAQDSGTGGGDTSIGGDTHGDDTNVGGDTHEGKDTSGGFDTTPPPPDSGPPPPTLDDVCSRLADVVCTDATKSCCASKGISYDDGGCRAGVAAACGAEVDAVKAGTMTFDPSGFYPCASVWASMESKCSVPILDFARSYTACEVLFNGKTAPGAPCTTATDCRTDGLGFAQCSSSSNTCSEFIIVGKDAACNYDGAVIHFCDYGLYCSPTTATCRTAKSAGTGCSGTSDTSCGYGNTCDSGHCAPGAPAGSSCFDNLSCASWSCDMTTFMCTDPDYEVATNGTCNGTP